MEYLNSFTTYNKKNIYCRTINKLPKGYIILVTLTLVHLDAPSTKILSKLFNSVNVSLNSIRVTKVSLLQNVCREVHIRSEVLSLAPCYDYPSVAYAPSSDSTKNL